MAIDKKRMATDTGAWLETIPTVRHKYVMDTLERGCRYSTVVSRLRRMASLLETCSVEGVAFEDIVKIHGVTFTSNTLTRLTHEIQSNLNIFANSLKDAVIRVDPQVDITIEMELRLRALTESVGPTLWNAIDAGEKIDHVAVQSRMISAVDALWNAHAISAIQAELCRFRNELKHLRVMRDKPGRMWYQNEGEKRDVTSSIQRLQDNLNVSLDSVLWHGVDVKGSGGIELRGPATHVSLVSPSGVAAHLIPTTVPTQGLALPVVRMARVLRVLVYGGFLKLDVICSKTLQYLIGQDIEKYSVALYELHVELSSIDGFDDSWINAQEDHNGQHETVCGVHTRTETIPLPSAALVHDTLLRRIDMQTRLATQGVDWAPTRLGMVDVDFETDYASMVVVMRAIRGYTRRCTTCDIQLSYIVPSVKALLASVGREYTHHSLVQKIAAFFKKLCCVDFESVECKLSGGRSCTLQFRGVNVVDSVCLCVCDLMRAVECNTPLPWKRVNRFRKRDKRKRRQPSRM